MILLNSVNVSVDDCMITISFDTCCRYFASKNYRIALWRDIRNKGNHLAHAHTLLRNVVEYS
jgi:hypothetical protein